MESVLKSINSTALVLMAYFSHVAICLYNRRPTEMSAGKASRTIALRVSHLGGENFSTELVLS